MIDLFDNISEKNKVKLLQILEAQSLHYKKNLAILGSIRKENYIAIVDKGYLHITKNEANGDKIIIEELEENDVFGTAISFISNSEYEIITKEESDITIIDFDNISSVINTAPYYVQFLKNISFVMSQKISSINERVDILTNKSIRNRLLSYFNLISRKNKSRIIYLPFNFSDLADYLAVNRSAMSRELKNLKEEGLIETKGKRIKLLYYNSNQLTK